MAGVSRRYLQSYLDEYTWRLENGNTDSWKLFKSGMMAVSNYYNELNDGNVFYKENIQETETNLYEDDGLDFTDYLTEEIPPLPEGDYNEFLVNQEIQNDSIQSSNQENIASWQNRAINFDQPRTSAQAALDDYITL